MLMTAMGIKPVIGVGRAHNDTFSREPPQNTLFIRAGAASQATYCIYSLCRRLRPQSERINIQNRIRFLYQPKIKKDEVNQQ